MLTRGWRVRAANIRYDGDAITKLRADKVI